MNGITQAYNNIVDQLPVFAIPLFRIFTVLLVAAIFTKISESFINRILFMSGNDKLGFDENKKKTLAGLLKSIIRYVTYFIAVINILEIVGINTASILTAAGIGGLAVGFGAQNLVKDIISGFFIIFEDQYNVGDYVETAAVAGIVDEIGLRTTKLRDFGGQLHIIPNGEVTRVTNHSRGVMRALVNVGIAYEEDLNRALKALEEVCQEVKDKREDIVEGPMILGVSDLGSSEVVVTLLARTMPMQQWSVERELRKAILEKFEQEDIEIPYPRMVYIKKENMEEGL
ncbi:MAG: mechanosensitive ion channel family protein [Tepidanaerobacteraceae bacterium]|nr:mechanosensitive ion channel family protein [Tepidanaerobacteraceae bacterium]